MAPTEKRGTLPALGILIAVALIIAGIWALLLKPEVIMVSDNAGSVVGGRPFVVSGKNLFVVGQTRVLVGGQEATKVLVQSPGSLTATAPPGTDGDADITVISPNGQRAVFAKGYTYSRFKPEISSVTPAVLPGGGGVVVTVKGSGFTASPIDVHFHTDIIPATIINDSTLTFIAPPAPHELPTNVNLEIATKDDVWSSDEFGLNYR